MIPAYSLVVPVYNSARILPELHARLAAVMEAVGEPFEMIFVEDCGPDNAWEVLQRFAEQDARVLAIQLMRNAGQGNATLCGLQAARGPIVITLDDDLQHPPEEIPNLIEQLQRDASIDVVIGAPRVKRHSLFRRFGSSFINAANSLFLDKHPELRLTGFRAMRRAVAENLVQMRLPYASIGPMLLSVTRRIKNITVEHAPRHEGKSGYTLRRIFQQTLANLVGFSMLPMHILAAVGGVGFVASLLLGSYHLARYFIVGITVSGWTSLMLILTILSSFNFFAFAIIGEYVLRIAINSSGTPAFIVRERRGGHVGENSREGDRR